MHDDVFGNSVYKGTDRLYREFPGRPGRLHLTPAQALDGAIDASLLFCKSLEARLGRSSAEDSRLTT